MKLLFGGGGLILWILFVVNSAGMTSTWVVWLFFLLGALIAAWLTLPGFVENDIFLIIKNLKLDGNYLG